jgi:deazaflavin-dependent oxidoreductase (nitroreductase family)
MHGLSESEAAERYCYLTTTGRVTGRPHEIEIFFAADGDSLYLMSATRDRADWVRNIRRNPEVRVRVGAQTYQGVARIIQPTEPEDGRARELLATKYQDWEPKSELIEWARTALPVAIRLNGVAP